jgi:hypothetical protein
MLAEEGKEVADHHHPLNIKGRAHVWSIMSRGDRKKHRQGGGFLRSFIGCCHGQDSQGTSSGTFETVQQAGLRAPQHVANMVPLSSPLLYSRP